MSFTFQVVIEEDIKETEKEIIQKYWSYEEGGFKFSPTSLKKEYNLSQHELISLVKRESFCLINLGECVDCEEPLLNEVVSQNRFKIVSASLSNRCDQCKSINYEKLKKEREEEGIAYKTQILERAINDRSWEKLDNDELEVLKEIIILNDRDAIFRNIFKRDWEGTWVIANKLERLGLIDIYRSDENSILKFHFLDELRNYIFNYEEVYENKLVVKDNFGFSLAKKINKTRTNQPDYSGVFTLPFDVVLKKGVEYVYGGWIQTDGSINLKFTPKKDVFPIKHSDIENQPEHIKDILSDMFNDPLK